MTMIGLSAGKARVLDRRRQKQQHDVGGPFTGPITRHLMYYICPMGEWRPVVKQMLDRIDLFNGRRVLGVAYRDLKDIKAVERFVGDHFDELLPAANIKELREVVLWLPCLERVLKDQHNDIIYTAHAKGVTHHNDHTIQRWTRTMYEITLDYPKAIERGLTKGAMTGCFLRNADFPIVAHTSDVLTSPSRWHYSGTFYWMRSKDLFCRDWRKHDVYWFGTESYPGYHFTESKLHCLVGKNCGDLYKPETWRTLQPEIDAWKAAHLNDWIRP